MWMRLTQATPEPSGGGLFHLGHVYFLYKILWVLYKTFTNQRQYKGSYSTIVSRFNTPEEYTHMFTEMQKYLFIL